MIKEQAEGTGTCASSSDPSRLEYKRCNDRRCAVPPEVTGLEQPLPCNQTRSLVILVSESESMGVQGFMLAKWMLSMLVKAFSKDANSEIMVKFYGGPQDVPTTTKCANRGQQGDDFDFTKECRQKTIQWTKPAKYTTLLEEVEGEKYTADVQTRLDWSFSSVQDEVLNAVAPHVNVIVISDGVVASQSLTKTTARKLRKSARISFLLIDHGMPLANIKKWATHRWQENLVTVQDMQEEAKSLSNKLKNMATEGVTHLVADICPDEMVYGRLIQANAEVPEGVIMPPEEEPMELD